MNKAMEDVKSQIIGELPDLIEGIAKSTIDELNTSILTNIAVERAQVEKLLDESRVLSKTIDRRVDELDGALTTGFKKIAEEKESDLMTRRIVLDEAARKTTAELETYIAASAENLQKAVAEMTVSRGEAIKTAVFALGGEVRKHWPNEGQAGLLRSLHAEFQARDLRIKTLEERPAGGLGHSSGRVVNVRIPDDGKLNLNHFSGKDGDKVGFVSWRYAIELHLDAVWPGVSDVFEKVRDMEVEVRESEFDHLVDAHCVKPHGCVHEEWSMTYVGRHLQEPTRLHHPGS